MKRLAPLFGCLLFLAAAVTGAGVYSAQAAGSFPEPSMLSLWIRTDLLIEQHRVSRTWVWGPGIFESLQEPYAESPGGVRLVAYFDKSRMEINNPGSDKSSAWFITNGLLTNELITGRIQIGDAVFQDRAPADIPVAGDRDDPRGPTYATFSQLLDEPAKNAGDPINESINREGRISGTDSNGVSAAYFVPETNHTVAGVFWDFLNCYKTVYKGKPVQGRLFEPVFFATGLPITEAYWADVRVGGQVKRVLIQCFERRVLTYTPDNPDGWKVEMGNIGRHYYEWRYGKAAGPNPTETTIHRFAVSTKARTYYYCDTDSAWRRITPNNLIWYDFEEELIRDYPGLKLHEECE